MNAQDSKAYSDYYERSVHYPDFVDYCEFVDECLLDEFLELYCISDIEDELGDYYTHTMIMNWWDRQLDTYKELRLKEAYSEEWRVDLFIDIETEKAEEAALGY